MGEMTAEELARNLADPECGLYVIVNTITGKRYAGSSRCCRRRFAEHRSKLRRGTHPNAKLQASWNKHGEAAFRFEQVACVIRPGDLEREEQWLLDALNCVRDGYNLAPTAGNTAGWVASPETRARMSAAAKKRNNTTSHMLAVVRGRKRPPEELQKIWEARRANGRGRPSDEARTKMAASAVARGCCMSESDRSRLGRMKVAGARHNDEDRARMVKMRAQGKKLREIGEAFGIASIATVSWHLRKARGEARA